MIFFLSLLLLAFATCVLNCSWSFLASSVTHLLHVRLRNVEQALQGQWGISQEVDNVRRRVISTCNELVEFLVLLRSDILGLLGPDSTNGVDLLTIEVDREANKVGVGLDDI